MSKNILSTTPKERLERRQKLSYSNAAGLNPSYAVENKWICYIPFKTILGDAYPNLELQCKQFYLPPIEVGISQVSFMSYQIKVPGSRIMNHGDKSIKFQYIVDEDWRNYSMLHTWASRFADYGYSVNRDNDNAELSKLAQYFATIRLWLLD